MVELLGTVIQLVMDVLVIMHQIVQDVVLMLTLTKDTADVTMVTMDMTALFHMQFVVHPTTETVIMLVVHSAGAQSPTTVMDVDYTLIVTTGDYVSVMMDMQETIVEFTIVMPIIADIVIIHALEIAMDQRYTIV
jgi:hypothetical protein